MSYLDNCINREDATPEVMQTVIAPIQKAMTALKYAPQDAMPWISYAKKSLNELEDIQANYKNELLLKIDSVDAMMQYLMHAETGVDSGVIEQAVTLLDKKKGFRKLGKFARKPGKDPITEVIEMPNFDSVYRSLFGDYFQLTQQNLKKLSEYCENEANIITYDLKKLGVN